MISNETTLCGDSLTWFYLYIRIGIFQIIKKLNMLYQRISYTHKFVNFLEHFFYILIHTNNYISELFEINN